MGEEELFVNYIVNEYGIKPNKGVLSINMKNLRDDMLGLIVGLRSGDVEPVPVFDALTIFLYAILTAKDKKDIDDFCSEPEMQRFLRVMHNLYNLSYADDNACREVLKKMQKAFAGKCINLALERRNVARNNMMIFSRNNPNSLESSQGKCFEAELDEAEKGLEKARKFCVAYKVG